MSAAIKDGTLWYYQELIQAFSEHGRNDLLGELKRIVNELELLAK
ncbi:unnamed protein product [marine sediment metagenome]|uniref:Uncharacterized protein n=1 Tax=marine sediment metagenome TaxID=412755 RepID=X1B9R7_9ZZZZ